MFPLPYLAFRGNREGWSRPNVKFTPQNGTSTNDNRERVERYLKRITELVYRALEIGFLVVNVEKLGTPSSFHNQYDDTIYKKLIYPKSEVYEKFKQNKSRQQEEHAINPNPTNEYDEFHKELTKKRPNLPPPEKVYKSSSHFSTTHASVISGLLQNRPIIPQKGQNAPEKPNPSLLFVHSSERPVAEEVPANDFSIDEDFTELLGLAPSLGASAINAMAPVVLEGEKAQEKVEVYLVRFYNENREEFSLAVVLSIKDPNLDACQIYKYMQDLTTSKIITPTQSRDPFKNTSFKGQLYDPGLDFGGYYAENHQKGLDNAPFGSVTDGFDDFFGSLVDIQGLVDENNNVRPQMNQEAREKAEKIKAQFLDAQYDDYKKKDNPLNPYNIFSWNRAFKILETFSMPLMGKQHGGLLSRCTTRTSKHVRFDVETLRENGIGCEIYNYAQASFKWLSWESPTKFGGLSTELFPWVIPVYQIPDSLWVILSKKRATDEVQEEGMEIDVPNSLDLSDYMCVDDDSFVAELSKNDVPRHGNWISYNDNHSNSKDKPPAWQSEWFDPTSHTDCFLIGNNFPVGGSSLLLHWTHLKTRWDALNELKPTNHDPLLDWSGGHYQRILPIILMEKENSDDGYLLKEKNISEFNRILEEENNVYAREYLKYSADVGAFFHERFLSPSADISSLALSEAVRAVIDYGKTVLHNKLTPSNYPTLALGATMKRPEECLLGLKVEQQIKQANTIQALYGKSKVWVVAYYGPLMGHLEQLLALKVNLWFAGEHAAGKSHVIDLMKTTSISGVFLKFSSSTTNAFLSGGDMTGTILVCEESIYDLFQKEEGLSEFLQIFKSMVSSGQTLKLTCEHGEDRTRRQWPALMMCIIIMSFNRSADDLNKAVRSRGMAIKFSNYSEGSNVVVADNNQSKDEDDEPRDPGDLALHKFKNAMYGERENEKTINKKEVDFKSTDEGLRTKVQEAAISNGQDYAKFEQYVCGIVHLAIGDKRLQISKHLSSILVPKLLRNLRKICPFVEYDSRTSLRIDRFATALTIVDALRKEHFSPYMPDATSTAKETKFTDNPSYKKTWDGRMVINLKPHLFHGLSSVLLAFTMVSEELIDPWYADIFTECYGGQTKFFDFCRQLPANSSRPKDNAGDPAEVAPGNKKKTFNVPRFMFDDFTRSIFRRAGFVRHFDHEGDMINDMNWLKVFSVPKQHGVSEDTIIKSFAATLKTQIQTSVENITSMIKNLTTKPLYNEDIFEPFRDAELQAFLDVNLEQDSVFRVPIRKRTTEVTKVMQFVPDVIPIRTSSSRAPQVYSEIWLSVHALSQCRTDRLLLQVIENTLGESPSYKKHIPLALVKNETHCSRTTLGTEEWSSFAKKRNPKKPFVITGEEIDDLRGLYDYVGTVKTGSKRTGNLADLINSNFDENEDEKDFRCAIDELKKGLPKGETHIPVDLDAWAAYKHLFQTNCCELKLDGEGKMMYKHYRYDSEKNLVTMGDSLSWEYVHNLFSYKQSENVFLTKWINEPVFRTIVSMEETKNRGETMSKVMNSLKRKHENPETPNKRLKITQ